MSKHTEFEITLKSPKGSKVISLSGMEIMEIAEFYGLEFNFTQDRSAAVVVVNNIWDYNDIILDYAQEVA